MRAACLPQWQRVAVQLEPKGRLNQSDARRTTMAARAVLPMGVVALATGLNGALSGLHRLLHSDQPNDLHGENGPSTVRLVRTMLAR
jgi:hypothetical protein